MAENHSNSDIASMSNKDLIEITRDNKNRNVNVNDAHKELKRRLEEYANLDSFDAYKDRLEDIQALAEKYKLSKEEEYANFANQLLNRINSYKNNVENQQQNKEEQTVDSVENVNAGQGNSGVLDLDKSTNGNEDAVKKAELALDTYIGTMYNEEHPDEDFTSETWDSAEFKNYKDEYAKNNPEDKEYKKLEEELEAAKGTKPQQQENSEVKTYTAEELKTLMHKQTNALYNREGLGADDFAKFHEEGKNILEAFVKGEVNVDSLAYTEMSGFINVFAGEYGDNNAEMKKLYDDATNRLESIKAEAKNKNDQENETNESTPQAESKPVENNEQSDSDQGGDQNGDQGGDQGDSDQGEGSEADKTEQKDRSQNSRQGIKITKDNALDVLNKQFHRLRPEEIIKLRKIIKEDHNDQLNNLDNKIIDKTQTFLAGETVILQTSRLYYLDNLLDSVREDNKDDGKGSTNQIGVSAANLKNEVGQRIKDFEELYGLDEQSRVSDEQIAKNVELLKDLPSFEKATYKESEAIAAERVSDVARQSTKYPPLMGSIVGALKSDGLTKVDKDRLLDLAVARIKDVKKADLIKNKNIADFQYLLGAVKESRPKVKVGKQEKLLFNAKKEYEKNNKNDGLSKDLQDAYEVLDRITVIGGTDPYGKRKVKGQEAEDIKNTFKEQCRLETEMFFANTNKGEKIDPKEFEKEYALRLQTGLLKLVNYEEASKLTAMKEGGEKDIAKAFENAFDSKKKIKISTVAFSAYHATEQDAINTACQKSPKALSAYVLSKNSGIKTRNESQLKRVFSLGKGLLESAAWATAFTVASNAPPLGVAIVAGLSFARQTGKLIGDFKKKREEEKKQGREYKFKDFVKEKENRSRMVGYALSAASTGLAIAAAAIPGANAALLMTARSTTMMMSLALGVKTTFDSIQKAKSWKEKLLIGGTFLATIAVGRFTGKSVQEVMANNFGDPVVPDGITGADQEQPAVNQQEVSLDSQNLSEFEQEISNLSEKDLAFRFSQITGKNPEGMTIEEMQDAIVTRGQDAYEAVLDRNNDGIMDGLDKDNDSILDSVDQDHGQGWATANKTQIDRAFDADPKGINEALKELNPEHKWMNSDQLHEMMENGQFNDDQLKAIHSHASSHFDENGHITDTELKVFYEKEAEKARRAEINKYHEKVDTSEIKPTNEELSSRLEEEVIKPQEAKLGEQLEASAQARKEYQENVTVLHGGSANDPQTFVIDENKGIIIVTEDGKTYLASKESLGDRWGNLVERITENPDRRVQGRFFEEITQDQVKELYSDRNTTGTNPTVGTPEVTENISSNILVEEINTVTINGNDVKVSENGFSIEEDGVKYKCTIDDKGTYKFIIEENGKTRDMNIAEQSGFMIKAGGLLVSDSNPAAKFSTPEELLNDLKAQVASNTDNVVKGETLEAQAQRLETLTQEEKIQVEEINADISRSIQFIDRNNLTAYLKYDYDSSTGTYRAPDGFELNDESAIRAYVQKQIVDIAHDDSKYLELKGNGNLTEAEKQFLANHEERLEQFDLYHDKYNNLLNAHSVKEGVLTTDGLEIINNPQRIEHGTIYGVDQNGVFHINASPTQPESFDVENAVYEDMKARLNDGGRLEAAEKVFMSEYETKINEAGSPYIEATITGAENVTVATTPAERAEMIKGAFNLEQIREGDDSYRVKNDEGKVIDAGSKGEISLKIQDIIDAEEKYQADKMTSEQKAAHEAELAKFGLEHNDDKKLIAPHDDSKGYTAKECQGYYEETKNGVTTGYDKDGQVTARYYTDTEGNEIRESFNEKGELATKTIIDSDDVKTVQSFSGEKLSKEVITPDQKHPNNTITKEYIGGTETKREMKFYDETTTIYNPTDDDNKITVKTEGGAVTSFEKGNKTYYPDENGNVGKITTKIDDNYYKEETKGETNNEIYYYKKEGDNYVKMAPEEIANNEKIKAFQAKDAIGRNSDNGVGKDFDKVFRKAAEGTGMGKGSIKAVVNMPVKVGGRD